MGLSLTLRNALAVPLEAERISPDGLAGKNVQEIEKLELLYGNERIALGEMFRVAPSDGDDIRVEGDLGRVKLLGAGMSGGRLVIHGDVGAHLGAGMSGGEIVVDGNAGDWVGPEMSGGRIVIRGDAGHMVGAALRGSPVGMRGGEILVHGKAGNETGAGMRRGLIAVGGDAGDFTAVNMRAGTIAVCGRLGVRTGAGMLRGTVVTMQPADPLPTFGYACTYRPVILRLLLLGLQAHGLPIATRHLEGRYHRWTGDRVELNRGELLVFAA